MGRAKDIIVKPVTAKVANAICREVHYSRKIVLNSQVHLGAFLDGRCLGVMQFGPPMDRRRLANLVTGTLPREMLELNRMAFSDELPRNSESRCLGFALRLLRRTYPGMKWIVSFADGCQCGDGTIYRAAGFLLVGIKRNSNLLRMPNGTVIARKTLDHHVDPKTGHFMTRVAHEAGARPLAGYQLKYVYFLRAEERENLACPVLPYSAIDAYGARMYRGMRPKHSNDAPANHAGEGGVSPTRALQHNEA